jgi:protoporphyrinogen oxidase
MSLLQRLLGADLQRRTRHGRIRMAGTFVAFPPRPADLLRHLPPSLSARLARDMVTSPLRRPAGDTFTATVRASLGPTMTRVFYAPYVEKLFGVPADQLSSELARRRVGARSAGALVRRVVSPTPDRASFSYPRRGYGQIADALADAATRAGAVIRTGCDVRAVKAATDRVDITTGDGSATSADAAWSTLPLTVLARVACAPPDVLAATRRLETRGLLLVYLVLPTPRWTPYDAHYFPERDVALSRLSEPKNYRDSGDDPDSITVLCAEIPCSVGEDHWDATPHDLAAVVRDALDRSALPTPQPLEVVVRRVPHAYPVYRVGFEAAFETLDTWASTLPRVLHFGRQGLFAHDNTHHALAMAWAAADSLGADGRVDGAKWASARASFARYVVED